MSTLPTHPEREQQLLVSPEEAGFRLDVYLASQIEDASRSLLKQVIKDRRVEVNGQTETRPGRSLAQGDRVDVVLPPPPTSELLAEDIPLDIVFEDEDLLIVNKPSGLVVHPAPGHATGTLVNAVLHHCQNFQRPGDGAEGSIRPGIVHRLDRFTSGLMVVAKSQVAFDGLSEQARRHAFQRRYVALVQGELKEDSGVIRASIGRSLVDRKRMSITSVNAREAVTRFKVQERFGIASFVELVLETGRTHQIRVHMRFAGRPILGDAIYGVTDFSAWPMPPSLAAALKALRGQALHAEHLGIVHPRTHEQLTFTAPLPSDIQAVLDELRTLQPQ